MIFIAISKIRTIHKHKNKNATKTLGNSIGYDTNDKKTDNGELTSYFECSKDFAHLQFYGLVAKTKFCCSPMQPKSKQSYFENTRRTQNNEHDIIAYKVVQSFVKAELSCLNFTNFNYNVKFKRLSPEIANKIGIEFATTSSKVFSLSTISNVTLDSSSTVKVSS